MKDIGSIFPICDNNTVGNNMELFNDRKSVFYALCREAILAVTKQNETDRKKALLPAYTCQTVIDPFVQEGWKCDYYAIDKNLRISGEVFLKRIESFCPSIIVVHPYFGADLIDEEVSLLETAKKFGCIIIEDLTQCVLSKKTIPFVDYYVGSLRKWTSIPDGAFLSAPNGIIDDLQREEYTEFVQPQFDAMYLRGLYYEQGTTEIKEISRRINKYAEMKATEKIELHKMSAYSQSGLSKLSWEEIEQKRMNNYRYLYEHLRGSRVCEPVLNNIMELTCSPLYFPIYVKDRNTLQTALIDNRIYAPVLWPIETADVVINDEVEYIYNHILLLPCDQRYSKADMDRIISTILH